MAKFVVSALLVVVGSACGSNVRPKETSIDTAETACAALEEGTACKEALDQIEIDLAALQGQAHDRYEDAEAVSAMGPESDGNPLNHARYTDAECIAAVDAGGYVTGPHFTDADAIAAMGASDDTNPLHHTKTVENDPTVNGLAKASLSCADGDVPTWSTAGTPRWVCASSAWTSVTDGVSFSGGNVGVGTTNPAATLDVDGTVSWTGINVAAASSGATVTAVSGNYASCGGGVSTDPWGADHAIDGVTTPDDPDSVWMDADCSPRFITVTFDQTYVIDRVSLAGRYDDATADGQPEQFQLHFSDGSSFAGTFPPSYSGMQTYRIRPVTTSSITYVEVSRYSAGDNGLRELEAYARDAASALPEARRYAFSTSSSTQTIPGAAIWTTLTAQPAVSLTTGGRPVRLVFHANTDEVNESNGIAHAGCTYAVDGVRGDGGTYGLGTQYLNDGSPDNHTVYSFSWIDETIGPGTHTFTIQCINANGYGGWSLPAQNAQGRGFFMVEEL